MTRIIPAACQRCTDTTPEVRTLAFQTIEALLYQARINLDPQQEALRENNNDYDQDGTSMVGRNVDNGSKPSKAKSSGLAGWAFQKAVEFYGSKQHYEAASMKEIEPQVKVRSA